MLWSIVVRVESVDRWERSDRGFELIYGRVSLFEQVICWPVY